MLNKGIKNGKRFFLLLRRQCVKALRQTRAFDLIAKINNISKNIIC